MESRSESEKNGSVRCFPSLHSSYFEVHVLNKQCYGSRDVIRSIEERCFCAWDSSSIESEGHIYHILNDVTSHLHERSAQYQIIKFTS